MTNTKYLNLEPHNPQELHTQLHYGLLSFLNFLKNNRNYLTGEHGVRRIGWEQADRYEPNLNHANNKGKIAGFWVQLVEQKGMSLNFNTASKFFLEEGNKSIYDDNGKKPFSKKEHDEINVLEVDPHQEQIKLESLPKNPLISVLPNTHQIQSQINALEALVEKPSVHYRPLMKLFERETNAKWPSLVSHRQNNPSGFLDPVTQWYILKDETREGTEQQRQWVNKALNTPDFAFLDGPPGSGKTTAICELILQVIFRGKRVLLTASTHVAIDNVLERIMAEEIESSNSILPIRIGPKSTISPNVKKWHLDTFVKTEKERLLRFLGSLDTLSESQKELQRQLRKSESIQNMVLASSNLVCGTSIGILQHPEIKKIKRKENSSISESQLFDLMIVDEASKTTFQEFLVPALYAKRWVLVGDPKQLSPYIDDEATEANIKQCFPDEDYRNACLDVFNASNASSGLSGTTAVVNNNQDLIDYYRKQAQAKGVEIATEETSTKFLSYAGLIVGSQKYINLNQDNLPLDLSVIRPEDGISDALIRRKNAFTSYLSRRKKNQVETTSWEKEIAWRLARLFEQRKDKRRDTSVNKSKKYTTSEKLQAQIQALLPEASETSISKHIKSVSEQVEETKRIAFPSILESLRDGFDVAPVASKSKTPPKKAITHGLPKAVYQERSTALTWQHRMHPDIAAFSKKYVYDNKALDTPNDLAGKREISYKSESPNLIWMDVKGRKNHKNANTAEVQAIRGELKEITSWVKNNPNTDSESGKIIPWEIAVLSFYRGQERALIETIGKDYKKIGYRNYYQGEKQSPNINIQFGTVDSFQGKEADMVLLSFVSQHPTSFLESPNRLNVAITRARYKLFVYGNRNAMTKSLGLLGEFAEQSKLNINLHSNQY